MRTTLLLTLLLAAMPAAAETAAGFKTEFYGFIKTDLLYSDHGVYTNEYRVYAASGRNDRAFRSSTMRMRVVRSRALTTSSASTSSGCETMARAMAMR